MKFKMPEDIFLAVMILHVFKQILFGGGISCPLQGSGFGVITETQIPGTTQSFTESRFPIMNRW